GKSYFVGTIRISLMSVDLKSSIGKAYFKIIFADLNGKVKQKIISPNFVTKDQGLTEIGVEYVFYTRDPSTSGLLFQLCKKNTLTKDKMMGEMRLLIDSYSKQGKQNRMWEVTKTFTRVIKI